MPTSAAPIAEACRNDTVRHDAARKTASAPQVFAQHIAAFYPYPAPVAPRTGETLRSDAARGPEATSPYAGLARHRRGRDPG